MRFRRFTTTLVILAPLVVLTVLAALLIRGYYRRAERDVRPILEQELARILEREVRIGKVTISGGHAYVDDVRVSEGKTFAEMGGREIVRAKQVVLDIDLRRILLSRDKNLPLFAHADVIEPVAWARRNAQGRWNFEDLFRPQERPPERPGLGTVTVVRGTVFYEDQALPRHPDRPRSPLSARLDNVNGTMQFYASRGATWQASIGSSTLTGPTTVTGSYDPVERNLLVRVQTSRAQLSPLSRFLPPDTRIAGGTASGRVTVTRTVDSAGRARLDYQSNIAFADGAVVSGRLAEPVTAIRGAATVANDFATVRTDGRFAGSAVRVEGTVLDFSNPAVNGWAQGNSLQLGRVLTALKLDQRVPALRRVAATATVRADVSGPLANPQVTASGPVTVRGALPGGVNVGESGSLQVSFAGTAKEPRFVVSGSLPVVRYQDYTARDVRLSGVYDGRPGGRGALDLDGKVGGGSVAARVNFSVQGEQIAYRASGRLRAVDLEKLPLETPSGDHPAGIVTGDLALSGRTGERAPRGDARLNVRGLELDGWAAETLQARIRSNGERVYLEPAVVSDSKGVALVTGSFGLRDRSLDLLAQVDNLDLAVWPVEQTETGAREADVSGQGPAAAGLVFLRDVAITGTLSAPKASGRVYAYDLRSDLLPSAARDDTPVVDYVVADFVGDRQALVISDGRAYRFPSAASVSGIISRPLSPNPRLDLVGSFDHVDVTDLARLAGVEIDASGLVEGAFAVQGTTRSPEIALPDISVQGARIGDFDFARLTAALRYSPFEDGGLWTLDRLTAVRARPNLPAEQWTTLTASGRMDGSRRFTAKAALDRLDLDLVEPYVTDFVTVDGLGEATMELSGRLVEGKARDLSGQIALRTRDLTVNRVAIGDLHGLTPDSPAVLTLREDRITSDNLVLGSLDSGVSVTGGTPAAPALVYDLDTDALRVNGQIRSISIDMLRQALANSPYVASNPDSIAARWLKPITNPFEGTIDGRVAVSGSAKEPVTTFDWATVGARIEGQAIDGFEGSISFTRERVDLTRASLTMGESVFNASGSLVPGKEIAGNVDTNNMPISLVKQWFPGRPILRDLEGVAESVHLTAAGDPSNPSLTASVLFRDVVWIETADPAGPVTAQPGPTLTTTPDLLAPAQVTEVPRTRLVSRIGKDGRPYETPTTGREVWIASLDTSTITVNGPQNPNQIRAENIHVTLREPDPLPTAPNQPRTPLASPQQFKIYARGQSAFSWQNADVLKNPEVRFEVNVPTQDIDAILALLPHNARPTGSEDDVSGTVRASLTWTGTIQEPVIRGDIEAIASQIRFAGRSTQIRDLDAAIDFTGDAIEVRRFTAFTEIVEPKSGRTLGRSEPIRLSGGLALTENSMPPAEPLRLVAERLRFAETDLRRFGSARLVTDDTRVDLTATGSLLFPLIRGSVDIRTADVRLPTDLPEQAAGRAPAFQPSFDIAFTLGDRVRVVSSPLSAVVRTPANNPVELRGDLLGGDTSRLRLNGTLVVESGTLAFPTARFTIQRGGRVALRYPFFPAGGFGQSDPTLGIILNDVRAVTHITASPANNPNQVKRYTITVEANGPLNSGAPVQYQDTLGFGTALIDPGLHLTFRADPPDLAFSDAALRRRITGYLGGETAIQGLFGNRPDIGRVVRQQVTDVLSESFLPGLLDQLGIGRALGFEEFAVDISQLNTFSLRLSRQLFGPVYLSYWQRLSGPEHNIPGQPAAWQLKLSYRFRPQIQFSFTTDDQRTNAYLLEGVFRF